MWWPNKPLSLEKIVRHSRMRAVAAFLSMLALANSQSCGTDFLQAAFLRTCTAVKTTGNAGLHLVAVIAALEVWTILTALTSQLMSSSWWRWIQEERGCREEPFALTAAAKNPTCSTALITLRPITLSKGHIVLSLWEYIFKYIYLFSNMHCFLMGNIYWRGTISSLLKFALCRLPILSTNPALPCAPSSQEPLLH